MSVTSSPLTTEERAERTLLDPRVIERTLPLAKAIGAIVGWANSAVTSVLCALWLEQLVRGSWSPIGMLSGLLFAFTFTLLQIYTNGRSPGGYLVVLLPDVLTTAAQHQRWTVALARALWSLVGSATLGWWLGLGSGWAVALLIGWYSARLPERLVFGRRSRRRR